MRDCIGKNYGFWEIEFDHVNFEYTTSLTQIVQLKLVRQQWDYLGIKLRIYVNSNLKLFESCRMDSIRHVESIEMDSSSKVESIEMDSSIESWIHLNGYDKLLVHCVGLVMNKKWWPLQTFEATSPGTYAAFHKFWAESANLENLPFFVPFVSRRRSIVILTIFILFTPNFCGNLSWYKCNFSQVLGRIGQP